VFLKIEMKVRVTPLGVKQFALTQLTN